MLYAASSIITIYRRAALSAMMVFRSSSSAPTRITEPISQKLLRFTLRNKKLTFINGIYQRDVGDAVPDRWCQNITELIKYQLRFFMLFYFHLVKHPYQLYHTYSYKAKHCFHARLLYLEACYKCNRYDKHRCAVNS